MVLKLDIIGNFGGSIINNIANNTDPVFGGPAGGVAMEQIDENTVPQTGQLPNKAWYVGELERAANHVVQLDIIRSMKIWDGVGMSASELAQYAAGIVLWGINDQDLVQDSIIGITFSGNTNYQAAANPAPQQLVVSGNTVTGPTYPANLLR